METAVNTCPRFSAYALPGIVRRQPVAEDIDKAVAREYGTSVQTMAVKSRKREIVEPRQVAMYLSQKYTSQSLKIIGSRYGKDHATVLHATKTVISLKDTDRLFNARLQAITDKLERAYELKVYNRVQGFNTGKKKRNE